LEGKRKGGDWGVGDGRRTGRAPLGWILTSLVSGACVEAVEVHGCTYAHPIFLKTNLVYMHIHVSILAVGPNIAY
jgi:hypothetical protein